MRGSSSIPTPSRLPFRSTSTSSTTSELVPPLVCQESSDMAPIEIGIIGIVALSLFIVAGIRIFAAAALVGFCGLWALRGFDKAVGIAGHIPYSDTTNYALSVLPLFIL